LQRKTRVYGAMKTDRGIPQGHEREVENMLELQSFHHRSGDILVPVLKDKGMVQIIAQL
jgi:hypothetical protein